MILFDKRGTGLSDASFDLGSFETRMSDIGVVMDAVGSERASLFGYSEGGPLALLYAATHPDRVESLILFGTFPSGSCITGEMRERLEDAIDHWGEGRTAGIFLADADSPMVRRFMGLYERAGVSPGAARSMSDAVRDCDVTPILPALHVPTVVIHRRDDPFALAHWGRTMADAIPGAHYLEIDGRDHLPWFGDPNPLVEAVERHVCGGSVRRSPSRLLGTVLFTDLVSSTSALTEMGDERWAETIQQHNDFCRGVFDEMDAWAVKSTGDGFIACFSTPERAVQCGLRLLAAMPELGLAARAGLHTGELERVDIDDVAGLTPVIASRISDVAGPGELLASRLASDLLVGSEHTIHSHGLHNLKGVPDPVEIVRIDEPSKKAESLDFTSITDRADRLTLRAARRMPTLLRALARLGER